MKINHHSDLRWAVTVYLDGKKVEDAVEASEEDGYVWACYRNAKGDMVSEYEAERGAMVHEGVQVVKLAGQVRIELDTYDPTDTVLFIPIQPQVKE